MYAQLCFKERSHTYEQIARIQSAVKHTEEQLHHIPPEFENDEAEKVKAALKKAHLYIDRALYHELVHDG
ncbi:hypothetical protein HUG15_11595 [Salicibibacter cibarius]|uniref:Uncharacterized protein n=1 Tax=Salicibibacter cibarius TaxID=2743000 RepID=A0A7T6Z3P5_9BACI|nr:hypothetical protein [Salicibibacter cibarius]QQK76137.1 hypothetical protein HUG15_11595 [Salicibibacter cibarius]